MICTALGTTAKLTVASIPRSKARTCLRLKSHLLAARCPVLVAFPATQRRHHSTSPPSATKAPQVVTMAVDPLVEETVEKIHSTPVKVVLYTTGGAAQVRQASCAGDAFLLHPPCPSPRPSFPPVY
jgi:hypothetical protein